MKNKKFENIIQKIRKFRDDRDWKQFHEPKNLAADIVVEASELLELLMWQTKEEQYEFLKNKKNFQEVQDELSDVFHSALLLAIDLDIDIEKAVLDKVRRNSKKYPVSKAKGKHTKYTKL